MWRRERWVGPRHITVAALARDPLLDWISVPSIIFPRLSPLRERVGFFWDPEGRVELYVADLRGGTPSQMTHGDLPTSPNAPLVCAPYDRSMAYSRDREGNELHDLCVIDCGSGAVRELTHDPTCQRYAISISPDGR